MIMEFCAYGSIFSVRNKKPFENYYCNGIFWILICSYYPTFSISTKTKKKEVSHGDTLFSPLFVKSQKNLVFFGLKEAQG